jgi:hypothetical protein
MKRKVLEQMEKGEEIYEGEEGVDGRRRRTGSRGTNLTCKLLCWLRLERFREFLNC